MRPLHKGPDNCLVTFTGGFISTLNLVYALATFKDVQAIIYNYGQLADEVEKSKIIAELLEVPHTVIDIPDEGVIKKKDFTGYVGLKFYLIAALSVNDAIKRGLSNVLFGSSYSKCKIEGKGWISETRPYMSRKVLYDFAVGLSGILYTTRQTYASRHGTYNSGFISMISPWAQYTDVGLWRMYEHYDVLDLLDYTVICEESKYPCGVCYRCKRSISLKYGELKNNEKRKAIKAVNRPT